MEISSCGSPSILVNNESDLITPAIYPKNKGITYLPGTTQEFLQCISRLPVTGEEVFIATYPKSGTTWVSEIIWQILHDGQMDQRILYDRVPFLDMASERSLSRDDLVTEFTRRPSPRIFKTHLPYSLVPKGTGLTDKPRFIYVVRCPRDCAVSYYHHYLAFSRMCYNRSWDHFFGQFVEGQVLYGSWFDHVLEWWEHREDPNILFLRYEDMKENLAGAIYQITRFLGKSLDNKIVRRIANQTTFDAMKNKPQFDHAWLGRKKQAEGFLRKGQVGDWRNYFSAEQSQRFDEVYAERMAGTGFNLDTLIHE